MFTNFKNPSNLVYMKKILNSCLAAACFCLAFASCEKQELPASPESSTSQSVAAVTYRLTNPYGRIWVTGPAVVGERYETTTKVEKIENGVVTDITFQCGLGNFDVNQYGMGTYFNQIPNSSTINQAYTFSFKFNDPATFYHNAPDRYYTNYAPITYKGVKILEWWVLAEKFHGDNPLPWPPDDL